MDIAITLGLCITISFLFMLISKKLGFSPSMGLIVGGVFIGSTFLEPLIVPNTEIIHSLGEIGFVFLMFMAGLEISWSLLYKEKKDATLIALFCSITPLLFGFGVFLMMGFDMITSFTIGICMSITAEATKGHVLEDLGKLKTRIGSIMMGAGIIDDVIGLTLFAIVSYIFVQSFVTYESMMLHISAIAAYFIGISVHRVIGRYHKTMIMFERMLYAFVIPFFFISVGIYFKSYTVLHNPFILLTIIFVSFLGKMLGSFFTRSFTKLNLKQLYVIGWGMNSRGAVELAIAFLAFRIGLITNDIFSGLIVMTIITTMLFPIAIKGLIKRNPGIMN